MQFLVNFWRRLTKSTPEPTNQPLSAKLSGVAASARPAPVQTPKQSSQATPAAHPEPATASTANPQTVPTEKLEIEKTPPSGTESRPDQRIHQGKTKVVSQQGFTKVLGDTIGEGGTSSIYAFEGTDDIVCKIFNADFMASHGYQIEEKVSYQLSIKHKIQNNLAISWPRTAIYSPDGSWLGYSMIKAKGVRLNRVIHPALRQKYAPNMSRLELVTFLLEIVNGVSFLNQIGIFVGDFNPENFLVDPNRFESTFIDSDGYQFGKFKCLFVKPEFIPPEHLDIPAEDVVRDEMSDSFSLAVLLFQSLMMLRHPYDSVGGGDLMDNIKGGHFPYGLGGVAPGKDGAIPPGPWYNMWSHLPYAIKNAFIRTLSAGVDDRCNRTSASSWAKLLGSYLSDLKKGYHRIELLPSEPKKPVYRGKEKKGSTVV